MKVLHRAEITTDNGTSEPTIKERIEALPLVLNPRSVLYDSASGIAPSSQGPRHVEHIADPEAVRQLTGELWDEMMAGNQETLQQLSRTALWES